MNKAASLTVKSGHDDFIQVWRGIAVLLVVYYHFSNRVEPQYLNMTQEPALVFHVGKIGVLVFFVISGFLIAKSLVRCENLAIFYAKRISRIWPLFAIASITIFLLLQIIEPPIVPDGPKKFYAEERDWTDLAGSILFLEDFGFRWIDGVFWSLLVELKFYFWIGILACFRGKNFDRDFALCAILLGIAQLSLSLLDYSRLGWLQTALNGFFIAQYLPFFAVGVLLATGKDKGLLSILLIIIVIQAGLKSGANPDFDMAKTATFGLILTVILLLDQLVLKSVIFLHLGHYSYSFYLFHQMIGLSVIKALGGWMSYDLAILIALAVTYCISALASNLAEWRFRSFFTSQLLQLFSWIQLNHLMLVPSGPGKGLAR